MVIYVIWIGFPLKLIIMINVCVCVCWVQVCVCGCVCVGGYYVFKLINRHIEKWFTKWQKKEFVRWL